MKFLDRFISSVISPPAFGLDISDFTIKFMKLERAWDDISIAAFGEVKIPEGIVVGGEIKKENELAHLLEQNLVTENGERFSDRFVVATLPEEKSFVHLIQLPKMKSEDAGKAVRWELEGVVPLPIEDLYFDHAILPSAKDPIDHLDILVTAFPKAIVESYWRVLDAAGFVVEALELESQAISRSLWSGEPEAFIYIDLGATRTSFMIVTADSLVFTLSVPLGGRDFDRAIAERLGVSLDEARKIKIEAGLSREYRDGAVYEALLPLVSALAEELKKQIDFYRDHSSHRHGMPREISAIVLSGGDANLIGFVNHLGITLKKEVKLGNPLGRLLVQKGFHPPFHKRQSLRYTAAIGSALRGINL